MKVSFEWLKNFVETTASPAEVSERLTMVGLEVEGMEALDGDTIYEVNVTPNRPDCLSILGIAREVAAAFEIPLILPETDIACDSVDPGFQVEIVNQDLCGRYAGRMISGVTVADSPEWIKTQLEKSGIRSLNNVVDITNYVLLELGHPLHAFDADRLKGNIIRIKTAGQARTFVTLDGVERAIPAESLIIWDSESPVAIAGIMGGAFSGVTSETQNVFLESAYFAPASIRQTSKELGLRSESSYRFERGTDIEFLENALNRAAMLIQQTGGGTIHRIVDAYPKKYVSEVVEVNCEKVNALLGTSLQKDEMIHLLGRIGISSEGDGPVFRVIPPAFRRDIQSFVDVVEEIARCYNFVNIPLTIPKTVLPNGILSKREINISKTKDSLRKSGFSEVINYSFMNSSDLDVLEISRDDVRRRCICLRNPLRQEESLMRSMLIPSLINNFLYNISRGVRDIRFFELSKVFIDDSSELPDEKLRVGGIYFQQKAPVLWKEDVPAFFSVRGALQAFFEEMRIGDLVLRPPDEVFLHRGKSGDVIINDEKAGFVGELAPHVLEKLNLKIKRPEIIVFELDLDMIFSEVPEKLTYSPIPKYPAVERDIALILDEHIPAGEVIAKLNTIFPEYIEHVELFDLYQGKNIPLNKKSLAFRIIYRLSDRTLTDKEVEEMHRSLLEHILDKTGGELRS